MFGVHQHAMPAAEDDGLMIRMPDAPAHVDLGVAPHLAPVPASGLRVVTQNLPVRTHRHARRVAIADHYQLARGAIGVLAHMSLAAASATERFVATHKRLFNLQIRFGDEEPFALAHEGFIAATQAVLGALDSAPDGLSHFGWLQRFHRRAHVGHAFARHCADEPVAFVKTAEEPRLVILWHQQQVALFGAQVDHSIFARILRIELDVEEFALGVRADVDAGLITITPTRNTRFADLHSRPDA